ncbi:MAG TPA: DUF5680 domain-containing protein [Patescibacteria group bacterium]|nr:DUF5680 domain-containing protein [Patescibacteria group bacterium]
MGSERAVSPEEATRKEAWLKDLANFIVEANGQTWAAGGGEVAPERPGYKELEYRKGVWRLRDSYTGYFRAPGMTTIYYKDVPAWTMAFGGHGQTEGSEEGVKETFAFLKEALMHVTPNLPFRGPREYVVGNKRYEFELLGEGDMEDCSWKERIIEDGVNTFNQTGICGIVINRDANRQPQLPWNR